VTGSLGGERGTGPVLTEMFKTKKRKKAGAEHGEKDIGAERKEGCGSLTLYCHEENHQGNSARETKTGEKNPESNGKYFSTQSHRNLRAINPTPMGKKKRKKKRPGGAKLY